MAIASLSLSPALERARPTISRKRDPAGRPAGAGRAVVPAATNDAFIDAAPNPTDCRSPSPNRNRAADGSWELLGECRQAERHSRRATPPGRPGRWPATLRPPPAHRVTRRTSSRTGGELRARDVRHPSPGRGRHRAPPPALSRMGNRGPGVAVPAFTTAAGSVDFALCHPVGDPRILIKVGALPGVGGRPGRPSLRRPLVPGPPAGGLGRRTGLETPLPGGAGQHPQPTLRWLRHRERSARTESPAPWTPICRSTPPSTATPSAKPNGRTQRGASRPRLPPRGAAVCRGARSSVASCGR